jgi:ferredoxin-NADP reductase
MTLVDRQRIARDTMAFWFDTNGARYEFRAGQHADFVFAHPCMGSENDNSRTFSLASSPHDEEPIMIAMRMRKTAFKSALKAVALGTKFIMSRPRGSFTLHRDITRPAVFLAGDDDIKTEEFGDYKQYQHAAQSDQGTGNNRSDSAL